MSECSVAGCARPALARGWCSKHYQRWSKHGDVNHIDGKSQSVSERMGIRTSKGPACWMWSGRTDDDGYGVISVNRKNRRAHRVAFEMHHGRAPVGFVLHSCDEPGCVNPGHLREGSNVDNMTDMVARGRSLSGERNPRARLRRADVDAIRADLSSGQSARSLARRYGVSPTHICRIRDGVQWREVTP